MANSCLLALVLLTIIKISRGDLSTCNHVFETAPPQAQPIAVDVCRTIVSNDAVSYKKYICNATNVVEEVYDTNRADCNGNLVSTMDVTSSINSFVCNAQGSGTVTCEYIMRQQPCDSTTPPTTYNIEPIPTGYCIQFIFNPPMGSAITRSFTWNCNDGEAGQTLWHGDGTCSAANIQASFAPDRCVIGTGLRAMSKYCGNKYYGPTSAPTQEPTMEPTGNPSMEPTKATTNPSAAPSATTYNPSMSPSVKVTDAFYSSTTKQAGSTEADYVPRIQMIGNVIFVSFTVIFMSFVL